MKDYEDSVFSKVDAYIAREMKRQRLPGIAIGIVKGDRVLYLQGYGRADIDGRPVTPDTSFGIGSISKSFTALAVLQLAESGSIDLDAPVQRYVPTFQSTASSALVTVRHLLNQTSGFTQMSTYSNTITRSESQDALEQNALAYAESGKLENDRFYRYSNANYVLLGYIVQQVSGLPYDDYVKKHIFAPLSMPNSFAALEEAANQGLAAPHRRWFGFNAAYDGPYTFIPGDVPAGYLFSSAIDMSHYLIAHINGGRYLACRNLNFKHYTNLADMASFNDLSA